MSYDAIARRWARAVFEIGKEGGMVARVRDDIASFAETYAANDELRTVLDGRFGRDRSPGLTVTVISFSFKLGLPREADLVFDVRFLKNPLYDPELKPFDGRDPRVAAYIESDADFERNVALARGRRDNRLRLRDDIAR